MSCEVEDGHNSESKITANRGKLLFAATILFVALGYFAYIAFQGAIVCFILSHLSNRRVKLLIKTHNDLGESLALLFGLLTLFGPLLLYYVFLY